jgi:hypothetical protein
MKNDLHNTKTGDWDWTISGIKPREFKKSFLVILLRAIVFPLHAIFEAVLFVLAVVLIVAIYSLERVICISEELPCWGWYVGGHYYDYKRRLNKEYKKEAKNE